MRDPMSWALPVFRAFGIPVKVHIFFFVIVLGLFLRQVTAKGNPVWWVDIFLFTVVILFVVILLHEFGHCYGARFVDGEAKEILIWPLGGLAHLDLPNHWKAHFIATAAGPAVNAVICLGCFGALAAGGFVPNLNPFPNPYRSEIKSYTDGRVYTSPYGLKLYQPGTATPIPEMKKIEEEVEKETTRVVYTPEQSASLAARYGGERALAPGWAAWTQRVFWLSWVLFLFNLIPAYPLDGGKLLQCLVWARTDHRRGVTVAAYTGFGVSVLFLVVSIAANEALFMGLALFMLYSCSMALFALEMEDSPFGYDFSAGYTSLERDDEPVRKVKRPGPLARWWQNRKARKLQREVEQRQRDDERMDQLLEKIARSGKDSLSDEERRFLERASARYRNRS